VNVRAAELRCRIVSLENADIPMLESIIEEGIVVYEEFTASLPDGVRVR
jgi:hypothetical protein